MHAAKALKRIDEKPSAVKIKVGMKVNVWLHAPASLPHGNEPNTRWKWGRKERGSRDCLDVVVKRNGPNTLTLLNTSVSREFFFFLLHEREYDYS